MSHKVYNLINNCLAKDTERLNILILYPSILQTVSLAQSRHKFFIFQNPDDKNLFNNLPDNFLAVKDDSLSGNPLYFTPINLLIYTHGHLTEIAQEYRKRLCIPTIRIMEPPKTNIEPKADLLIFTSEDFKAQHKKDGVVINLYNKNNIDNFDEACKKIC